MTRTVTGPSTIASATSRSGDASNSKFASVWSMSLPAQCAGNLDLCRAAPDGLAHGQLGVALVFRRWITQDFDAFGRGGLDGAGRHGIEVTNDHIGHNPGRLRLQQAAVGSDDKSAVGVGGSQSDVAVSHHESAGGGARSHEGSTSGGGTRCVACGLPSLVRTRSGS